MCRETNNNHPPAAASTEASSSPKMIGDDAEEHDRILLNAGPDGAAVSSAGTSSSTVERAAWPTDPGSTLAMSSHPTAASGGHSHNGSRCCGLSSSSPTSSSSSSSYLSSWGVRAWTYSYMNPILHKGARQTLRDGTRLSAQDLYAAPRRMHSRFLAQQFRSIYEQQQTKQNKHESQPNEKARIVHSKRSLLWALWCLATPTFLPAGLCQLVTVLCQVAVPVLVRELLQVLESHPGAQVLRPGFPYVLGMFLALFFNALANHRHRHLAMQSGVVMRAALVRIIYQHVLQLAPAGRVGLTSGQVTNLVAVDTHKIYEVAQEGHLIWSLPLAIALVTGLLLWTMGPTTLIGIGVLVFFVPVVQRLTAKMLSIRQERAKMTDRRVEIINAMLQGIKVTKLNNYEASYENRVVEARQKELHYLYRELLVWAASLLIIVSSPVIAAASTFSVYVLISEDHILTAAKTFSVLLLFSALRFPINFAGRLIGKAAQALAAVERITHFLERETREVDALEEKADCKNCTDDFALLLSEASFQITNATLGVSAVDSAVAATGFRVSKFNLTVRKGQVLAVCGPVGSGKSTLINGIIQEVARCPKTVVASKGTVAYVPQTPFILNNTLRENILFGRPFKQDLYDRVLDACCLCPDIELLGRARDLTEIGERGVTLSGGQKQRVSLARAAYAEADLVLLDDPLSALDAGTAKLVFERLIKSEDALFANTAVVLVTHASHFLNRVDNVLVIVDGRNEFLGTWEELATFNPADAKTKGAVDFIKSSVQEDATGDAAPNRSTRGETNGAGKPDKLTKDALMTVEEREHGLSSLSTWLLWFRRAGGLSYMSTLVFFLTVDRFAYVGVEWWLARWTSGADQPIEVLGIHFPAQTDGRSAQYDYLKVYASLVAVSVLGTALRSEWSVTGGAKAAQGVFASMLSRVLRAPMSYFETTPMGRILNRFTYDTEIVDFALTTNMSMFLISCSWYVAGVIIMSTILPWIALALFPVTLAYWFLLLHYRKSGADLQRLDAVSRSPIQAMVTEGLDGSSTIRVFRQEAAFIQRYEDVVDLNTSALLNFVTAQRWLGVRIELLGSLVVLVASLLIVCLNDQLGLSPGIVALLIVWASNFTITLGFLVDTFSDAEAAITAIERVDAMTHVPQEKDMATDKEHSVAHSWPELGQLEFDNVCLRYRPGLPLALNNLSFTIPPGKSCGVVGRTGAGKSSLTVALWRLVELESGVIRLDGVDLATLGLSDVRGRRHGMSIIPQDPFLAGSTLRECLDPFGESRDEDILEALQAVRLAEAHESPNEVLNRALEEGGANYSVGERQLLNLARALLSQPVLLCLDEASASIDGETDAFIQKMLRTRFQQTTLITIAHRLNTIMDYDLILVMDAGRAIELGPPASLLAQEDSVFAQLVDATGPESSKALRAMVTALSQE